MDRERAYRKERGSYLLGLAFALVLTIVPFAVVAAGGGTDVSVPTAYWIIGIFAIFVGAFSVANIMFVSVKERTNVIGIKKALGAKQYVILLEFLIESVILCLIGGLIGLIFVFVSLEILTKVIDFNIYLSFKNVVWGLVWSVGIGIVSGFIPALQASRMNPVDAIRSK